MVRTSLFLLFLLLSGCASYQKPPMPARPAQVIHVNRIKPLTAPNGIKATPFTWGLATGSVAYMGLIHIPKGAKIGIHKDDEAEMLYFLKGKGVLTIQGQQVKVSAGSFVYMPKDVEVSFVALESVECVQVFAPSGPERKYRAWSR